jgi:hypothetical protein
MVQQNYVIEILYSQREPWFELAGVFKGKSQDYVRKIKRSKSQDYNKVYSLERFAKPSVVDLGKPWHWVEDVELDMRGPGLHAADRRNLQNYHVPRERKGSECLLDFRNSVGTPRLAAAAGEARRNRARCCASPPLQRSSRARSLARSLRFRLPLSEDLAARRIIITLPRATTSCSVNLQRTTAAAATVTASGK